MGLLAVGLAGAGCERPVASFDPVTPGAEAITNLFAVALVASAGVLLLVSGLLAVAVLRFRRRGEPLAQPSRSTGNRRLELLWTAGPLLLVVVLFVLTIRTMHTVAAESEMSALEV
jgi:cytochrome c oxidase subunit 2